MTEIPGRRDFARDGLARTRGPCGTSAQIENGDSHFLNENGSPLSCQSLRLALTRYISALIGR